MMFRYVSQTRDWYTCVLIYNFCAFAMQMPLGILADRLDRNYLFAIVGCILVGAAYGFTGLPLVATVVVGLGNALFHLGGGIDVLNISREKSGALGVFVSPGAFGVYFGTMLGKGETLTAFPLLALLLVAAGAVLAVRNSHSKAYVKNAPISPETPSYMILAAVCLFVVVCLRSYVGFAISFPWRNAGYWGLALVCASAFGKAAGGFLFDRFGEMKTVVVSLGAAALLFFIPQFPVAGVASILLFNMTMPITLWAVARMFPGAKGFSFGLLTFALFLGFLPVHLGLETPPFWVFTPLALVSLTLLLVGLRGLRGDSR